MFVRQNKDRTRDATDREIGSTGGQGRMGARPAGRGTQLPKPWREYFRTGEVSDPSGNGVTLNRNLVTVLESGIAPEQLGSDPSASAMTSPIVSQLGDPRNPLHKVKAPTPTLWGSVTDLQPLVKMQNVLRCFIENQGMPEIAAWRPFSVQGFQARYQDLKTETPEAFQCGLPYVVPTHILSGSYHLLPARFLCLRRQ